MLVMIVDLFDWWYGQGLNDVWRRVGKQTAGVLEMFSVILLAQSLFAPFRQIDAGNVRGSFDVQLRAWFDRSFSRVFGFFLRGLMIIIGTVGALIVAVIGAIWAIAWAIVPLLPIIGLLLAVSGWTL